MENLKERSDFGDLSVNEMIF